MALNNSKPANAQFLPMDQLPSVGYIIGSAVIFLIWLIGMPPFCIFIRKAFKNFVSEDQSHHSS